MYKPLIQCLANGQYLKIEIVMRRRKSCYAKPTHLNVRHLKLKTSGPHLVEHKISTSPDLDLQFLQYCLSYYINFLVILSHLYPALQYPCFFSNNQLPHQIVLNPEPVKLVL